MVEKKKYTLLYWNLESITEHISRDEHSTRSVPKVSVPKCDRTKYTGSSVCVCICI
ncbi:hypothetical protein Hdeb2414_s0018g00523681 [Helianthus debilis subsp. tardiflorus]